MKVFITISVILTFFPLIPLFIYFRTLKNQEPSQRYIAMLMAVSFLIDLIGMVNGMWLKIPRLSNWIFDCYFPISIVLIVLFYKARFSRKCGLALIIVLVSLLTVYGYLMIGRDNQLSQTKAVPGNLVFIVISIYYFYKLVTDMPDVRLQTLPVFWINTAFLLYYAGTLVLFIFTDYLVRVLHDNLVVYWSFHNFLSLIKYFLITWGLSKAVLPGKSESF